MNVGITSFGAYIPYHRIARSVLTGAWGGAGGKGALSVAGGDEDAVTMAVEAAGRCLEAGGRERVDALYFASVTAPYAELGQASLIAAACDLRETLITADFAQSLRSGASAMRAAADAVGAGTARQALVAAADQRCAHPKSPKEQLLGDAAAALTFGSEGVIAELECAVSVSSEIIDCWRNAGERYVNCAEGRFAYEMGYRDSMGRAVTALLEQAGLAPAEIAAAVFTSPGLKESARLAGELGFSPAQTADNLMLEVGDCGCAQAPLLLSAALERAAPGDRVLLAAYGSGADAFLFRVTDAIASFARRRQVRQSLAVKAPLDSYSRFLSFRGVLATNPGEPFRTFPSNAAYYRDRRSILRFHGSHCTSCGAEIFPVQRVCWKCGAKDRFTQVRLAERRATVFTYSIDTLAGRSDDPVVVQTVSEDAQGVRYYSLMTDFRPEEVRVGLEVAFTFRKIYEGGNYNNYFWKCRPVREGGENV